MDEVEISLESNFVVLISPDERAKRLVIEAVMALLYGVPPDKQREFMRYVSSERGGSGSLLLETKEGKEYLIGRDFNFFGGQPEIFGSEGMRLLPQPATALMDLLCKELATLNPLDFEALYIFDGGNLRTNQDSPGLWERLQQLAVTLREGKISPETVVGAGDDDYAVKVKDLQRRIDEITRRLERFHSQRTELLRIEEEVKRLRPYEVFLSDQQENLLEELSRQLTAVTLERRIHEERYREIRATRETIKREIAALQKKIASFDHDLFNVEFQSRIMSLIKLRKEKNAELRNLEKEYENLRKGKAFFTRSGEKTGEEKINNLLQELSALGQKMETLLKGRPIEQYLKEVKLYQQYHNDLRRLENLPANPDSPDYGETLKKLIGQEEEIRTKLESLLLQADSTDLKALKGKVNRLGEFKKRQIKLEKEIKELTGGDTPETFNERLEEEKKALEKRVKQLEEARVARARAREEAACLAGKDPALEIIRRAGVILAEITGGEYEAVIPEFKEGRFLIRVKRKDASWVLAEDLDLAGCALSHLAFRLSLVCRHTPVPAYPLIFKDPGLNFDRATKERICHLLQSYAGEVQIILLLTDEKELPNLPGHALLHRLSQ